MNNIKMEYASGTDVYTSDGQKVGRIDQLVIDPRTREVTHLVVRKRFLCNEDKVIPVNLVAGTTPRRVTLRVFTDRLKLPKFEEVHYIRLHQVG